MCKPSWYHGRFQCPIYMEGKRQKREAKKFFQEIGYGGAQMALGMHGNGGSIEN